MDVAMPDGTVIQGVPDGTTKAQLTAKYAAHVQGQGQPQSLGDQIGSYAHGIYAGLHSLPQSVAELGARGLDATGLTDNSYKNLHGAFQDMNSIAANGQTDNRFYKGGQIGGQVVSSLPAMELKAPAALTQALPRLATGILPKIATGAAQGAAASALTSNTSDAPLTDQMALGAAGGAALPMLGGAIAAAIPKTVKQKVVAPTIEALKKAAGELYRHVDNSGVAVSADAVNQMADSAVDRFGSRLDPTLHPDATAALNRIAQFVTDGLKGGSPAAFSDLDTLRRVVADAAKSPKPADAAMGGMLKDHIDDFVDRLSADHLDTSAQEAMRTELMSATAKKGQIARQIKTIEQNNSGALAARGAAGAPVRAKYMALQRGLQDAEAARQKALGSFHDESALLNAGPSDTVDALNKARSLWSRAKQGETIQGALDKADISASGYSQAGEENAIRARFRQMALNDKIMAALAPEVRDAVKSVAKGTPVNLAMRGLGKFAPHGVVSSFMGAGAGFAAGGIPGAIALPLLGEAARYGATASTKAAAQRALDTALIGGRLPVKQVDPRIANTARKLGLFGGAAGAALPALVYNRAP